MFFRKKIYDHDLIDHLEKNNNIEQYQLTLKEVKDDSKEPLFKIYLN